MWVRTYIYSTYICARAVMNVMIHNLRYSAMHFCIYHNTGIHCIVRISRALHDIRVATPF